MVKPIREFNAYEGQYSIDIEQAGPQTIAKDLDKLMRMFDPLTTHELGEDGGISSENIQDNAINDNHIKDITINDSILGDYTDTGKLTILLSLLARAIKELKGTETWSDKTKDTISEIISKADANIESIESINREIDDHRGSGDHDERYYTKDVIAYWLKGGDTNRIEEVFEIVNPNNGDGTFSYTYKEKLFYGQLTEEGHQIFELVEGNYTPGKHRIEVTINDTLRRSQASGGLEETSSTSFALTSPEGAGAEVTVVYYERISMAGEYTVRISPADIEPPDADDSTVWFAVTGTIE